MEGGRKEGDVTLAHFLTFPLWKEERRTNDRTNCDLNSEKRYGHFRPHFCPLRTSERVSSCSLSLSLSLSPPSLSVFPPLSFFLWLLHRINYRRVGGSEAEERKGRPGRRPAAEALLPLLPHELLWVFMYVDAKFFDSPLCIFIVFSVINVCIL